MAGEQTKVDWPKLMDEALDPNAPSSMSSCYSRFHEYSITNMFLFMMQGYREPMASFKRWNGLGRKIRAGQRAGEVIVPLLVTEKPPEDETLDEKRERIARLVGFKVVRGVFGLSQTEGPELPEPPIPGWDLQTALTKLGIREVPFDQMNGNVQGVSRGTEFAINPVAENRNKTVLHELGHVVLGHTIPHHYEEYQAHRGVLEFQAEATAYLVGHELEIYDEEAASHSRAYIRHWMDGERPPDQAIRQVFTAADRILRAGRLEAVAP
jgi:antirestriction protein ArdC